MKFNSHVLENPAQSTGTSSPCQSQSKLDWVIEQWRSMCEHSLTHMAVFDRESRIIALSPLWIEDFEGGRLDHIGQVYYAVHPDTPQRWRDVHQKALEGGVYRNDMENSQREDGSEFWSRCVCHPWQRPDHSIGGFIVSMTDLTPQLQADQHRRAAEASLHLALNSARAGIWEADLVTGTNKWSDEIWSLYGLVPNQVEATTDTWRETVDPMYREQVVSKVITAVENLETFEIEWRVNLMHQDRWLLSRGCPVVEPDGSVKRYIGIVIDITVRKMSEGLAASKDQELRNIIDAIPVAIGHLDRELRYVYANRAYEAIYGMPAEQLVGITVDKVVDQEALIRGKPYFDRVFKGEAVSFDNEITFSDGKKHHVHLKLVPAFDITGMVSGYYGVVVDLAEKRHHDEELGQLRYQLEQSTNRHIAEQTIMAVAHELNQPLHAAAVYCEALSRMLKQAASPSEIKPVLKRVTKELQRAGSTVAQLLDFVRFIPANAVLNTTPEDMGAIAAKALQRWNCEMRPQPYNLLFDASKSLIPVFVESVVIEKVILNLLHNACEAIGCSDGCIPEARISVRTGVVDGQARLCIEDNGGGVTPEMRPRLFEPLKSNKVGGLGLGLVICRQLVELHGGRIWHEDRPNGSAFCISLPLAI